MSATTKCAPAAVNAVHTHEIPARWAKPTTLAMRKHSLTRKGPGLKSNKPPARVAARALLSTPERKEQSGFRKTLSAHLRGPTDFQANRHAPRGYGSESSR